jgi:hypothetical protein
MVIVVGVTTDGKFKLREGTCGELLRQQVKIASHRRRILFANTQESAGG